MVPPIDELADVFALRWASVPEPVDAEHEAFLEKLSEILERLREFVEGGEGESAEAQQWWRALDVFTPIAESGWWQRRSEVGVAEVLERIFAESSPDFSAEVCAATVDDLDPAAVSVFQEARLRLVDELAARDRQFAAEIGEYRKQVAAIAGSPDPRKREALARYGAGDRAGGFGALVEIQRAETKTVAAGWREIGPSPSTARTGAR